MSSIRKALICGVSGQDGAYLASLLLRKGYEVVGTSRQPTTALHNLNKLGLADEIRVIRLDLADSRAVSSAIRELRPNEIYNLSGQSSPGASFDRAEETMRSIVLATLAILEAIRQIDAPIRFVDAGSSESFADVGALGIAETTAFGPRNPYGIAKAAAARLVNLYRRTYGLHASVAYLFNHESPLRNDRFVTRKVVIGACQISSGIGKRLRLGNLGVERDWGWAPEYVEALSRILQRDAPDDFVIGTGTATKLERFVELVFQSVGLDWRQHVDIDQSLFRPGEPAVIRADPSKAARLLGWRSTYDVQKIASEMVQHERAQHSAAG